MTSFSKRACSDTVRSNDHRRYPVAANFIPAGGGDEQKAGACPVHAGRTLPYSFAGNPIPFAKSPNVVGISAAMLR
jgi:hypothetical protein